MRVARWSILGTRWCRSGLRRNGQRASAKRQESPIGRCQRGEPIPILKMRLKLLEICVRLGKRSSLRKLVKPNRPTPIRVKHSNHHLHRMWIEAREISIHERSPQFLIRKLSRTSSIYSLEKGIQRWISAWVGSTTNSRRRPTRRWCWLRRSAIVVAHTRRGEDTTAIRSNYRAKVSGWVWGMGAPVIHRLDWGWLLLLTSKFLRKRWCWLVCIERLRYETWRGSSGDGVRGGSWRGLLRAVLLLVLIGNRLRCLRLEC